MHEVPAGNSQIGRLQFPKWLDLHSDGGRFSLAHPLGEGRSEGEVTSNRKLFLHEPLGVQTERRIDERLCNPSTDESCICMIFASGHLKTA